MRLLALSLALSLTGCALRHSGQLRAPRVGAVPPIAATAPSAPGRITFVRQLQSKWLDVWAGGGCPGTAVSIREIYNMAAENGVFYLEPDTAKIILATRTPFGIAIQIGGYATGGAAVGTQLAKAGSPLVAGFSIASAILGWLLPAMEHNAPTLQCAGQDLLVNSLGCGGVIFCAQPSAVGAFSEISKSEAVK